MPGLMMRSRYVLSLWRRRGEQARLRCVGDGTYGSRVKLKNDVLCEPYWPMPLIVPPSGTGSFPGVPSIPPGCQHAQTVFPRTPMDARSR